MPTNTEAVDKILTAVNEGSDAVVDAIRAANDRGHRFTTAMLESAQENQREAAEIARRWLEAPFDMLGLLTMLSENTMKAQSRALDATRQVFSEMADAQKETRELIQRVVSANRTASEATVDFTRGLFNRATDAVQAGGNGRRAPAAREAAKATGSAAED